MRFYLLARFFLALCWTQLATPVHAQDINEARTKCVQFGFKENTKDHDACVKQYTKASGSKTTVKPAAPIKPNTTPLTPVFTAHQIEEEYWKAAKKNDSKEEYEAYIEKYPEGRYAGLARAQLNIFQENQKRREELEVAREEEATRQKELEAAKAAQSAGPSANYGAKVAAAIRPHIQTIKELSPSLRAEYAVYTDASGRVTTPKLLKSSGDAYWDEVALKAILKTERLPIDDNGRVPSPMTIVLRPRD